MPRAFTIEPAVQDVLRASTLTATSLTLPAQLTREQYVKVNKVIEGLGGKWNRKAGAHLFRDDPRQMLADVLDAGQMVNRQQATQAFYTPAPLAEAIVRRAGVAAGMQVLEPSAGHGALADPMRALGADVTCCEFDPAAAQVLRDRGFKTYHRDFLTLTPNDPEVFERIVMNPPFTEGQDVAHVQHALKFLAPGGTLISVMSRGVTFRQDRKYREFRALVEAHGGTIEPLPDGSFIESGTSVSTSLVVIPNQRGR